MDGMRPKCPRCGSYLGTFLDPESGRVMAWAPCPCLALQRALDACEVEGLLEGEGFRVRGNDPR